MRQHDRARPTGAFSHNDSSQAAWALLPAPPTLLASHPQARPHIGIEPGGHATSRAMSARRAAKSRHARMPSAFTSGKSARSPSAFTPSPVSQVGRNAEGGPAGGPDVTSRAKDSRVRLNAAPPNFISLRQFFIIATAIEQQADLISLDSVFPAHLELAGRLIDG